MKRKLGSMEEAWAEARHFLVERAALFPELVEALKICEDWLTWWRERKKSLDNPDYEADRAIRAARTVLAKAEKQEVKE